MVKLFFLDLVKILPQPLSLVFTAACYFIDFSDWSDWRGDTDFQSVCLFCDMRTESPDSITSHMKVSYTATASLLI